MCPPRRCPTSSATSALPAPEASSVALGSTPCAAWSREAAELAEAVAPLVQSWPETPTTQSLVADGQLVRLLPGRFVDGASHLSMVDRALALGCALGEDLRSHHVLAGNAAAWVYAEVPPTMPLDLITSAHRSVVAGARVRQMRVDAEDLERIGGAPLTVPDRTASDLLRSAPADVALRTVQRMISCGQADPRGIRSRLRTSEGLPGLPRARELFERLPAPLPIPALAQARAVTLFPSAVTR